MKREGPRPRRRTLVLAAQCAVATALVMMVLAGNSSVPIAVAAAPSLGHYVSETIASSAVGGHANVDIYLPPGYRASGIDYPVLYLLHGEPGSGPQMASSLRINAVVSALIDSRQIKPMVIVLPTDGPTARADTEWMNSVTDTRAQWGTFIARDLVAYVDRHYAVCRTRTATAIGGVSMGAFGALNAALGNLGEFGTVLSWSGYFVANTPAVNGPTGSATWRAASPLYTLRGLVPRLRRTPLQISFYTTPTDHFASENMAFSRLLASEHLPFRFALHKGPHEFTLWREYFVSELTWLSGVERC